MEIILYSFASPCFSFNGNFLKNENRRKFTALSSPNCNVYDEHLSGKRIKTLIFIKVGIMSKLILCDENIWIHFVCLHRLRLDVRDKF